MNKEALRKLLYETAWAAWKSAANAYRLYPDNKHTFSDYWANLGEAEATTRLAALDDGGGVMGIDFAKWIEENCEVIREPKIILYQYDEHRHGEGVGNYTLDDIYTTYKDIVGVDDGQEGNGLRWVKASERLPEEGKEVFAKNGKYMMVISYKNGVWYDDLMYPYLTQADKERNHIEWLDEGQPAQGGKP